MVFEFGVRMQLARTEHEPEAPRVAQREANVFDALFTQRRARVAAAAFMAGLQGAGQPFEAQRGNGGQQSCSVAEVMRRRGR